jgi:hypothetical protein
MSLHLSPQQAFWQTVMAGNPTLLATANMVNPQMGSSYQGMVTPIAQQLIALGLPPGTAMSQLSQALSPYSALPKDAFGNPISVIGGSLAHQLTQPDVLKAAEGNPTSQMAQIAQQLSNANEIARAAQGAAGGRSSWLPAAFATNLANADQLRAAAVNQFLSGLGSSYQNWLGGAYQTGFGKDIAAVQNASSYINQLIKSGVLSSYGLGAQPRVTPAQQQADANLAAKRGWITPASPTLPTGDLYTGGYGNYGPAGRYGWQYGGRAF